jgi:hypothetical protein
VSIRTTDRHAVALYDSVSRFAFGPTFESNELALDFEKWAREVWTQRPEYAQQRFNSDLRSWTDAELENAHSAWFAERVDGETGQLLEEVPA